MGCALWGLRPLAGLWITRRKKATAGRGFGVVVGGGLDGEAGRCCGKGKKPQQGNHAPPRNLVFVLLHVHGPRQNSQRYHQQPRGNPNGFAV